MDFSKIKKIFYIVVIVSMLLSIKSRVFAVSVDTSDNVSYNVPDFIFNNYYFLAFRFPNTADPRWWLVISDSTCTLQLYTQNNTYMARVNAENNGQIRYRDSNDNLQYIFNNVPNSLGYEGSTVGHPFFFTGSPSNIEYICNYDVYDTNGGSLIFSSTVPTAVSPHFDNLTEIQNGYPDGVFISRGDYSENDALYFHLLKITNTVPDGNQSTYYYDSKVFKLTKDSKYYKIYDSDTDNNYSYYYVERSALTLDTNSSYLYVLSNSGDSITNSYGILQPDTAGGIYDVVESDSAGVITEQQALNDKITNINNNQQDIANSQQEIANNSNNINNFLNENTVSSDTHNDVDTNLQFNNNSPQFAELQLNFFSRLSSIIADFGNYTLDIIDTINIPVPHSNNTISLRSDLMTSHIPNDIKFIINAFWCFIFGKYFLNYLLLIYKLITTGQLIDYYSSNDEIIVTDVL